MTEDKIKKALAEVEPKIVSTVAALVEIYEKVADASGLPTDVPNEKQVERAAEMTAYFLTEGHLYARGVKEIPTNLQLGAMSALQVKIRDALRVKLKSRE